MKTSLAVLLVALTLLIILDPVSGLEAGQLEMARERRAELAAIVAGDVQRVCWEEQASCEYVWSSNNPCSNHYVCSSVPVVLDDQSAPAPGSPNCPQGYCFVDGCDPEEVTSYCLLVTDEDCTDVGPWPCGDVTKGPCTYQEVWEPGQSGQACTGGGVIVACHKLECDTENTEAGVCDVDLCTP